MLAFKKWKNIYTREGVCVCVCVCVCITYLRRKKQHSKIEVANVNTGIWIKEILFNILAAFLQVWNYVKIRSEKSAKHCFLSFALKHYQHYDLLKKYFQLKVQKFLTQSYLIKEY